MTDRKDLVPAAGEFLVFVAEDGTAEIDARISDGAAWPNQEQIAVLYGKDVRTINEHRDNVYEKGEPDPDATIRKFRIVQIERNRTASRLRRMHGRAQQPVRHPLLRWRSRSSSFAPRIAADRMDGRALHVFGEERRFMTDIGRLEAEFPLCSFTGKNQRGFILQPGNAT